MAAAKWIGGFLGFISGGPLGALAGYALGALFEKGMDAVNTSENNYTGSFEGFRQRQQQQGYSRQQTYEGQRNSFRFSLLVLAAYIIRADGKVMHSEMELVRYFLRQNFGEEAVSEGDVILRRLFEHQKQTGDAQYRMTIRSACQQIAQNMDYSQRLQLLNFLVMIAQADGEVHPKEVQALREVAVNLGLSAQDVVCCNFFKDLIEFLGILFGYLGIKSDSLSVKARFDYLFKTVKCASTDK